jgi:hypothetical protein
LSTYGIIIPSGVGKTRTLSIHHARNSQTLAATED